MCSIHTVENYAQLTGVRLFKCNVKENETLDSAYNLSVAVQKPHLL